MMEKTSFADWYPILKPLYLRTPTWISGFLKEATELKDMETKLWFTLIREAQDMIDQGKMHPSRYSWQIFLAATSDRWTGFARDLLLTLSTESDQIEKGDALTKKQIAFVVGHAWPAAA